MTSADDCELRSRPCQVQVLTLNGEPRMIMPIHAAAGLCGICSDGRRVFVTDIDLHKVHVLRLTGERGTASERYTPTLRCTCCG